jgi:hypothetical protein
MRTALVWLTTVCAIGGFFFGQTFEQSAYSAAPSRVQVPEYFPSELDGSGAFFSDYLSRIGEPSLLTAAKEPDLISYRFESIASQTGRMLAVRLFLNPDGSAKILVADESGTPRRLHRTESGIAAADVDKFLQLVENARFWSMPTVESENRDLPHKVYKMDASTWILEGVRRGGYHVVLRQGPEEGRFTKMVRFLLKDLAKLGDSVIPRAFTAP